MVAKKNEELLLNAAKNVHDWKSRVGSDSGFFLVPTLKLVRSRNNDKKRAELEQGDCLPSRRTLVVKLVGGHGCANERSGRVKREKLSQECQSVRKS